MCGRHTQGGWDSSRQRMRLAMVATARQRVPYPTGQRNPDQRRRFAQEALTRGLRSLVGVDSNRVGVVARWANRARNAGQIRDTLTTEQDLPSLSPRPM
jgi:hypothetical protein